MTAPTTCRRGDPTTLVARTRPLAHGEEVDPVAFADLEGEGQAWVGPDLALGTAGVALELDVAMGAEQASSSAIGVATVLSALPHHDDVGRRGAGPLAMGALPFDPAANGSLMVPQVIVGKAADGTRWVTTIAPDRDPLHDLVVTVPVRPPRDGPGSLDVRSMRSAEDWRKTVAAITARIDAGEATKVVLVREVRVTGDTDFDRRTLVERLHAAFPSTMVFSLGALVGASPELLVSRHGRQVRSHPLAGTAPRSADPSADARLAARLLASTKDRWEHQITIDRVHETLLPHCSYLDAEAEPSVIAVANVQHLGTMVEGQLSEPPPSALELALRLHPTPAVGGEPRDAALAIIDELEQLDRGCFAGPVGWVDAEGNGTFAVAIRSAHVDGPVARLIAGGGIVADSEPEAELAESRVKLQALLNAVVRP